MTYFHPDRRSSDGAQPGNSAAAIASEEMLAPVIAGAYARGMAETLDLLGVPGLLLDGAGEVLFATGACTPLLNGPMQLHHRHLVARSSEDNRVLEAFIADALGECAGSDVVRLPRAALDLRRLPRTAASGLPGQMLRAVLLLADPADPRQAAMLKIAVLKPR